MHECALAGEKKKFPKLDGDTGEEKNQVSKK